jgi:hypothetical protein
MIFTLHKIFYGDQGLGGWDMQQQCREMRNELITAATEPSVNGDAGVEVTTILKHILEKQCVRVCAIHTVQDGNRWWVLGNTVMKIQVS